MMMARHSTWNSRGLTARQAKIETKLKFGMPKELDVRKKDRRGRGS